MDIDPEIFDSFKSPSPDAAAAAIPKLAVEMLLAFTRGGETALTELKQKYRQHCETHAPKGTRARLMMNIIWNAAEKRARNAKMIIRCRHCLKNNRVLAHRQKDAACALCKFPLHLEDATPD